MILSSGAFSGKDTNGALEGFLLEEELLSKNRRGEKVRREKEQEGEKAREKAVLGRDLQ